MEVNLKDIIRAITEAVRRDTEISFKVREIKSLESKLTVLRDVKLKFPYEEEFKNEANNLIIKTNREREQAIKELENMILSYIAWRVRTELLEDDKK